jgi:CBS domain containing-hemolysin-like protein
VPPRRPRRPPKEAAPVPARRWWRKDTTAPATAQEDRSTSAEADEQERVILEALQDMRHLDVREVMTPRVDVTVLKIPVHVEDVARAVRESGHSSFPVVHDDLDDLVGVLFVTDLFRTRHPSTTEPLPQLSPIDISRRLRSAYVVPESRGVLETLYEMRRQRRAFAVVVDEYGGVAGVLTMKDLLEPLVGDLNDEFDPQENEVVRVDAERWLVDGRSSVDDVEERLGLSLPEGEYVTLGGFLFDAFGHIPEEGERLSLSGWDLRVVEMDRRRVAKVVITRPPGAAGEMEGDPARRGEHQGHRESNGQRPEVTSGAHRVVNGRPSRLPDRQPAPSEKGPGD